MDIKKSPKKQKLLSAKVLIIVSSVVTLFFLIINLNSALTTKTLARKDILIASVKQGDLDVTVDGYGTLKSDKLQLLTTLTKATVKEILLKPGALVNENSVIVQLENPELEQLVENASQALVQAQANLRQLVLNQQRELLNENASLAELTAIFQTTQLKRIAQQTLLVKGIVSQLTFKETQLNEQQYQQRISIAKQRLKHLALVHQEAINIQKERIKQQQGQHKVALNRVEKLTMKAGSNGVLQRLSVELGQSLQAGQEVALIGSVKDLIALIRVSQNQAQQVVIGQKVIVNTRQDDIIGQVSRIDPVVRDNTVEIEVSLPKQLPTSARPQQNVDAVIVAQTLINILYIERPINVKGQSQHTLYQLDNNNSIATRVLLSFNSKAGRYITITSGAKLGDKFIISDLSNYQVEQIVIN